MHEGASGFEVRLDVGSANRLSALITRESAENLGLRIGSEVHAFVKATAVSLVAPADEVAGAPNRLCGVVERTDAGTLNAEVAVRLQGGPIVTALVGLATLQGLRLAVGSPCCARIEPSSVILVRFD